MNIPPALSNFHRVSIARCAPIPLRLIVGFGFMQHGFAKLMRGPSSFAVILHQLGVPAPHLMAQFTILTEIVGGLAVLLGALVPLFSVPMGGLLLVAMATVHLPYGFSSIKLTGVIDGRLGHPATNVTCSTSPAWPRSFLGVLVRCRSTVSLPAG
jgi:putative oxidoreductase